MVRVLGLVHRVERVHATEPIAPNMAAQRPYASRVGNHISDSHTSREELDDIRAAVRCEREREIELASE